MKLRQAEVEHPARQIAHRNFGGHCDHWHFRVVFVSGDYRGPPKGRGGENAARSK